MDPPRNARTSKGKKKKGESLKGGGSQGGGSSRGGGSVDTMQLKRIVGESRKKWVRLQKRRIEETEFLYVPILEQLGLREPVYYLLNKVGLGGILGLDDRTYVRYTLEFLSTLELHNTENDAPYITFHINDKDRKMTYSDIRRAFGIEHKELGEFNSTRVFNDAAFFAKISNGASYNPSIRSSLLVHPALQICYFALCHTFLGHPEWHHLPSKNLKYVWAMTPDGKGCPDWVDLFVNKCLYIAKQEKGKICIGGLVSLLAYFKDEDPTGTLLREVQCLGNGKMHYLTLDLMEKHRLIEPTTDPRVFRCLVGGDPYLLLPQPDKTNIDDTTTTQQLYLPPDDFYRHVVDPVLGGVQPVVAAEDDDDEPVDEDTPMADVGDTTGQYGEGFGSEFREFKNAMFERMEELERSHIVLKNAMDQEFHQFGNSLYGIEQTLAAMARFHMNPTNGYQDPSTAIQEEIRGRDARWEAARERRSKYRHGSSSGQ